MENKQKVYGRSAQKLIPDSRNAVRRPGGKQSAEKTELDLKFTHDGGIKNGKQQASPSIYNEFLPLYGKCSYSTHDNGLAQPQLGNISKN